jgi:uridine kinase
VLATAQTPYFVGIAGGSGSGKTTVAKKLFEGVPAGQAVLIQHDSYYRHRPELSDEERDQINFDHPDALDNTLLIQHLDALRQGQAVDVPVYDFHSHLRSAQSIRLEPAPIVLVEGILILVDEELRRRIDLKIFVDTDSDIRVLRRIRRDMQSRGRSFDQVREQYYSSVRPMHLRFVEPSKSYADMVLPEGGANVVALDVVLVKLMAMLGMRPLSQRPPPWR